MTPEGNKDLVRRWLAMADAGFNGRFEDFIAEDYVGHLSDRPPFGLDDLKALERRFASAFSDARRSIEELIAEGDKVALRVVTTALHTGEFHGVAPTLRPVRFSGIVIYRIEDGRIAEAWGELDFGGLWRQLTAAGQATVPAS